jgi:hypothetical protein
MTDVTGSDANGEPGVVAILSTHARAHAAAEAARACGPTSLAVYLSADSGWSVVHVTGAAGELTSAVQPWADVALHETATRRILRHRRTWETGTATPGLTRLYLTHSRPGLSTSDYHRYWEREHAPRALRHHLGMWDYTQVSVIRTMHGPHVHGIALTGWYTAEDLADRFTDGTAGDLVIHADAATFTDLERLSRHEVQERLLLEAPWPATGVVHVGDARSQQFDRPAEDVWDLVGRFDSLLDWWPGGFVACTTHSEHRVGMTRFLTRADGSVVVERLVEYRPDERMLQLTIDTGLPEAVLHYTCRYEVRPLDAGHCRLDWYPRAAMRAEALDTFGSIVDRGWTAVSGGLAAALAVR